MNNATTHLTSRAANAIREPRTLLRLLVGVYVWLSFVKLPVTAPRDSAPQSWEAVLSFATAHNLQWGRDIVFTFGPLGFLTSDYYWGNFLLPIMLWAFFFAAVLTVTFLSFSRRITNSIRIPLYAALPLLTVPLCQDLGFDAVYILSVTLLAVACLPGERPTVVRLMATGLTLAILTAIKFTFSIYSVCALFVIVVSNCLTTGRWRNTCVLISSWAASFLIVWWCCGQKLSGLPLYISRSLEITSGYTSAMALTPKRWDLTFGIILLVCLVVLLVTCWLGSQDWKRSTDRVLIIAAGIFLAWKEGFVRADIHVVVFFVYSFLIAALLPALLPLKSETTKHDFEDPLPAELSQPPLRRWLPRFVLPLAAITLLLSLAPFATYRKSFGRAVQAGFVPRFSDTFTALFAPAAFKHRVEKQFESMRRWNPLPQIAALTADAPVGVLNCDQEIAILNGLNYTPHPVFQNYSAYTPELQRLNAAFFNSDRAPEYVLWRTGALDERFPTLDDGEVFLRILSAYSPVMREGTFTLWKRDPSGSAYSLVNERKLAGHLDQWFSITNEPTWLRIELRETWAGVIQNLVWSSCEVRIEVQFEDGKTKNYRLPPGNARYGFVVNPLLEFATDKLPDSSQWARVVAVRARTTRSHVFNRSILVSMFTIRDVPMLESATATVRHDSKANEN